MYGNELVGIYRLGDFSSYRKIKGQRQNSRVDNQDNSREQDGRRDSSEDKGVLRNKTYESYKSEIIEGQLGEETSSEFGDGDLQSYPGGEENRRAQQSRRNVSEDYDNIGGDLRGRSSSKNSGTEVKFSLKSFSEQVDDVLSGADTVSTHLKVREDTPKILQDVGLGNKPILITSVHTKTAVGREIKNKNTHNLSVETLKKIPKLLENPAMIIESDRENSIVVFVNALDEGKNPILCSIKIDGKGFYNNIRIKKANILTSVYGKDTNPIGFIKRAVDEERVLYWDKKMSQDLFYIPGLQLPDNLLNLDSNIIIRKISKKSTLAGQYSLKEKPLSQSSEYDYKVKTILDESKTRKRNLITRLEIETTNAQAGIEKFGKSLGVENIESLVQSARASKNAGISMIIDKQFNYNCSRIEGDGLDSIFNPILKRGETVTKEFYTYLLANHHIDRMKYDKPVLFDKDGAPLSVAEARNLQADLLLKNSEFLETAKRVWLYSKNLLQYQVDAGLITKELADDLIKRYPHYIPVFHIQIGKGDVLSNTSLIINSSVKVAKGRDLEISDIYQSLSKKTLNIVDAAKKHNLINALYEKSIELQANSSKEQVDDGEIDYESDKPEHNQIIFYKDGQRIALSVNDEVFDGFEALYPKVKTSPIIKTAQKVMGLFKKLVTDWNPLFTISNAIRDFQEALFYTKHSSWKFIATIPKTFKYIKGNNVLWQKYKALGGLSSSLFENGTAYKQVGKVKKIAKWLPNKIAQINSIIEQIPRFTEFILSIESGKSLEQALLDSADVTTNFSRIGGDSRGRSSSKNSGTEVKFSLKSFSEQVDDVVAGKHDTNYDLYVGETPQVFLDIGFENKPLLMRNSKVNEILKKHPEMSVEIIKRIPQAISDPVMIIKSKTNPTESVVAITDIQTSKGEMVIPVWINQDGTYLDVELGNSIRINTNFVASAYGRSIKSLLEYAINNSEVLFYAGDKKRVSALLATHGLQLPARLSTTNFNNIIRKSDEKINKNFDNYLENPKFSLKARSLTDGQAQKKVANLSRKKVYSRQETEANINTICRSQLANNIHASRRDFTFGFKF